MRARGNPRPQGEREYDLDTREMLRLRSALDSVVERANQGKQSRVRFLVPPNNKCSGPLYEMVMMLDTWLQKKRVRHHVDIGYSTYEKGYIQAFGPRLNDVVTHEFERRGIAGRKEAIVERVGPGKAFFKDGSVDEFDLLISFPPYVASTRFEGLPFRMIADSRHRGPENPPAPRPAGHLRRRRRGELPGQAGVSRLASGGCRGRARGGANSRRGAGRGLRPGEHVHHEQFDKATFAQEPLPLTGNPDAPVTVREDALELYKSGLRPVWRIAKKMLGAAIPQRFTAGQPFHAGASWALMESGVKVMAGAFSD